MKTSLRLVAWVSGGLLLTAGGVLLACSSDDTVTNQPDGGGTPPPPPPPPNQPPPPPGDGGQDSGFDGGFKVDTFPDTIAAALCKSLARCCYGTETPGDGGADGGTLSVSECQAYYRDYGFEASNVGHKLVDAGHIAIDQTAANDCITKIKAMSCNLSGADYDAIRTACFQAYSGTLAAGQPCNDESSIECTQGNYCLPDAAAVDGGPVGTCVALNGTDASCANATDDIALAELSCSWRVSGIPNNHCTWYDPLSLTGIADAGTWKCEPAVAVGDDCGGSNWCAASVCNDNSKCETPNKYFDPICKRFVH